MGIGKYLNKIQEEKEIKKSDRLRCKICGREVTINKAGKGPLVCCDENMIVMGRVVEAGFSKYPKGWTQKSVQKFANTLSKEMKGGPHFKLDLGCESVWFVFHNAAITPPFFSLATATCPPPPTHPRSTLDALFPAGNTRSSGRRRRTRRGPPGSLRDGGGS